MALSPSSLMISPIRLSAPTRINSYIAAPDMLSAMTTGPETLRTYLYKQPFRLKYNDGACTAGISCEHGWARGTERASCAQTRLSSRTSLDLSPWRGDLQDRRVTDLKVPSRTHVAPSDMEKPICFSATTILTSNVIRNGDEAGEMLQTIRRGQKKLLTIDFRISLLFLRSSSSKQCRQSLYLLGRAAAAIFAKQCIYDVEMSDLLGGTLLAPK